MIYFLFRLVPVRVRDLRSVLYLSYRIILKLRTLTSTNLNKNLIKSLTRESATNTSILPKYLVDLRKINYRRPIKLTLYIYNKKQINSKKEDIVWSAYYRIVGELDL